MSSQQQSLKKEADVVFQQHNFKKAAELYTNAIDVDPSSELAGTLFSNRSLCHHKLGNFQEALKDGISATTLKPKWARGYLRVASAYESLGKEDEAIEAYQKSLDLEENQDALQKYIALFRKNVDNMKKTQEELKVIGNGYVQKNKYEEAVIIYNASIDLDPSIESSAPIYSNRSLAFFNLGRFKEAEDDACMAIFLRPEFARGYLRRGNAAMKLEKWKESSEAFEKYFELDPENAKSDPDLVKSKKLAKKSFDQNEADKRKHERLIEKTRQDLMAIKNKAERCLKATDLMQLQLGNPTKFDVELARVAVECGVDLTPVPISNLMLALHIGRSNLDFDRTDNKTSPLLALLGARSEVSPKILPQIDELLFSMIDEIARRQIPLTGFEMVVACSEVSSPLNPKIVRVLLETNKFDLNRSFGLYRPTPLMSLVQGLMDVAEVPSEALDCLHLLLNWKGIDVNVVWRHGTGDKMRENHVLDFVRHPEVARILIRHGANVNQVTATKGATNVRTGRFLGESRSNTLHAVLTDPGNPNQGELVQLYIRSGARLLANGKDGKSSSTLLQVTRPSQHPKTKQWSTASEEVLHVILQLNQQQGLLVGWQDPSDGNDHPLLHMAVAQGSLARVVQILCSMYPEQMKQVCTIHQNRVSIAMVFKQRIETNYCTFEESMRVLGVLLDHGFDLFAADFVGLWNVCRRENHDLNLVKNTIIEKRGEGEFLRCMVLWNLFRE